MKKFISILAIAVVTMNFVSCRQEDETADIQESITQQNKVLKKSSDSAETGEVASAVAKPEVDPDPPVRDGTRW